MVYSKIPARRKSPLLAPHRTADQVHLLFKRLETLAAAEGLVLVPAQLVDADDLPRVDLDPKEHDLEEFVAMMTGLGIRGLYISDGVAHMRHVVADGPVVPEGPRELRIEAVHGGVLHVWTHTG